ncbi:salicylate carboxymethyltransferase-like [Hibiscus syriacus]|nr:salicylate carboxymethyltransferase-like [Hibiscus syriacus]
MEIEQFLHMNGGDGKTSYANNSAIQKQGMYKAKPMLEDSIKMLFGNNNFPKCLKVADLGCSSGPNTLLLVQEILDVVDETCCCLNHKAPVFQVFLNDLPGNDFNAVFRSLPSFTTRLMEEKGSNFGPCFIAAMPGTFYGRLFPNNFLHFVHSSYIFISDIREHLHGEDKSPQRAQNLLQHFRAGLQAVSRIARFEEMVPGGHMVLTIVGSEIRTSSSKTCTVWELEKERGQCTTIALSMIKA